jgi:deoxyribodipyrimidine photo-lyase
MKTKPPATDPSRAHALVSAAAGPGPVVYWMSRDQRADDNWALLFAQERALARGVALGVVFCLVDRFLGASPRHFAFMMDGLRETADALAAKAIPFFLLHGDPGREIPDFARKHKVGELVTDFDPLRIKRQWRQRITGSLAIPFVEVDAHNVVPCRIASRKREFGAYTLRPKIRELLPRYLTDLPRIVRHPHPWLRRVPPPRWAQACALSTDPARPAAGFTPGEKAARAALRRFLAQKLAAYPEARNDPTVDGQSNLSPYLHFGQLSAQRVALEVERSGAPRAAREAFLEELIVRRELSDNFCFYEVAYDSVAAFPDWARSTFARHAPDPRPYLYTAAQLEAAETHDTLWNAAQQQMIRAGKMHGYLRMYWGKKILEWTRSPEEAMEIAIGLNDRYELDGRDPNGYAGIAWCIGGVHDRPWPERPVFGKIRYMNENGCRRKFDADRFVRQIRERSKIQPP